MRITLLIVILIFGANLKLKAQITEDSVKARPAIYLDSLNLKNYKDKNWLKAIAFVSLSEHDSAIYFLNIALNDFKNKKDTSKVNRAYVKLAWENFQKGDYKTTISLYQKAYDYISKTDDCKNKLTFVHSEAIMHYYLKNYSEFTSKLKAVFPLAKECNDTILLSEVMSSLSVHYFETQQYDSALFYINKKINLLTGSNKTSELAHAYSILGDIYYRGFLDKKSALKYYKISEKQYDLTGNNDAAFLWIKLSEYYLENNELIIAKNYAQKAYDYYLKKDIKDGLLRALNILAKVNLKENNIKELYSNLRLIETIQDSIYRKETAKQYAEMQIKYETEKKESENNQLKVENKLKETEIETKQAQQKTLIISFTALLLFIIALAFFINYKRKIKAQQQLQEEEKLRFKAVIEAEEKERIRIAKELHDGLGQLLSTAKLNVSSLEGNVDKEDEILVKNASDLIDNAVSEVRSISHNMMPIALTQLGLISAVKELIGKMNDSGLLNVQFESNIEHRLNTSIEIAIYRVVQEILNNIIKHAQAKEIVIKLNIENQRLTLQISDDGVGFNTNEIDKSKGIGWKSVFSRIAMLNGNIDVNSSQEKGTNLLVSIPVND